MKRTSKIFICIVLILVALILATRGSFLSVSDTIRAFFKNVLRAGSMGSEIAKLSAENTLLKSRIESETYKADEPYHGRRTRVYSRYPSNDRSVFTIAAGGDDGMETGAPVITKDGMLIGKISDVRRTQSDVLTIFSPNWRSSAGIGASRVRAVLQGGGTPKLDLIPKEGKISEQDVVFNLSPEYPLDAYIGNIKTVYMSGDGVWQNAELRTPYELQDVDFVFVLVDFP
ncbi:MAG: hypothetical protein UX22_C0004G0030 [Candidatus Jorgensenbacteria bacterium GW2011_GWA2_45_9]|uniref:Cell shape-determining protein MreC n=2 Tax=Candidatus Joergenseniibacteriota TaxID=1752739 RepID=A0A0G1N598_9BACT|nr:MAG: hypothetical protein UX22_C0004G0030 [Candidatus Jorgensenbacteria bacterium GW2011_GWA2_45_9]